MLPFLARRYRTFDSDIIQQKNAVHVDTKKLFSQRTNTLFNDSAPSQNDQIIHVTKEHRKYVHHAIYNDVAQKTPLQRGLEERVQSLFNEDCDPNVREFIIRDLVRQATEDDQDAMQAAVDLLGRLDADEQLDLPAVNREYVSIALKELGLTRIQKQPHIE